MLRVLFGAALATLLAGCVTTDYRYYGERDYRDYDPVAADSGYVGDGGYAGSVYVYPDWFDYPAYYSIYWPLQRYYVDPYWHPSFYYGVTWFPRNYFSIGIGFGAPSPYDVRYRWWPHYGYLSYSPYRLSWVDYYYDWYPWYVRYPNHGHDYWNHYYAPRYGSARNEAERLSRFTGLNPGRRPYVRDDGLSPRRWDDNDAQRQRLIERREAIRGADYGSRVDRRQDPRVGGFRSDGVEGGRGGEGRSAPRIDPRSGGAAQPAPRTGERPPRVAAPASNRSEIEQRQRARQDEAGIPYPYREEAPRSRAATGTPPQARPPANDRGERIDRGDRGNGNAGIPVWRERPAAPVERAEPRGYSTQPRYVPRESSQGDYSNERRYSEPRFRDDVAPATRFSAPRPEPRPEPQFQPPPRGSWSAPEPSRSRDADRYDAPREQPAPRYVAPERESRGESSRDDSPRAELNRFRGDDRDDR